MSGKTEQPTAKKLRDARKKGQVANSKEVTSTAAILALLGLAHSQGETWHQSVRALLLMPPRYYGQPFGEGVKAMIHAGFELAVQILVPVCGVTILAVAAASFAQVGLLLTGEAIKPSLKKINPASAIKRIFSLQNLFEFGKSILKIVFLSLLIVMVVREGLGPSVIAPSCGFDCVTRVLDEQLYRIILYASSAFVLAAALDFYFQRWNHLRQLKMSKDEVKREYKEMEGDPMIKGQRKQLHQQMINEDTAQRTRKATVLVTNPTRIAVALYYDQEKTPLPTVLAKGENLMAQRMIEIAQASGIPIMQNVPLARALHADAALDQYVPSDLIESVAEVLKWVQQLERGGLTGS